MGNQLRHRCLTGTLLGVGIALFLLINLASSTFFTSIRLDLTDNKAFTLSEGTKQIISELDEPITLRFYFSKKLAKGSPYLMAFATRVQDLLARYQRYSNGKITLEMIDPQPFTEDEDQAVNYGLQGVPVDNEGNELYLGLVGTNATDVKQVISIFQPNREVNLEYDITQVVYHLAHTEPRVVGVLSSVPIHGQPDPRLMMSGMARPSKPWMIWQQMGQQFDLEILDTAITEVPERIKTLMLVHPSNLSKEVLYAIDQFVMRGGHIVTFVDPKVEVEDQQTAYLNTLDPDQSITFDKLLASWGVALEPGKVVASRANAKSVRIRQDNREISVRYPVWMDFSTEHFAQDDILTGSLEKLTFATPGSLTVQPGATSSFVPLVKTTDEAMLVDTDKLGDYQADPSSLMRAYQPSGSYVVAGRITGPLQSAFAEEPAEGYIPNVTQSNIIVVADVDMLFDHFWVSTQNLFGQEIGVANSGNGNFVLSALENLSGSNALISIRNRAPFSRPFETIRELEMESQEKYQATEVQLLERLEQTKQQLNTLEAQKKEGNVMLLSVQQKQQEEAFRKELLETRKELRDVRRKLNEDIEQVEFLVKFLTIGFIPMLIMLGGLLVWGRQVIRETRVRIQ